MQFSVSFITFALVALSAASPVPKLSATKTGAAPSSTATAKAVVAASGGSVLTAQAYNDFQISSGTAGNAEANANALFAKLPTDLSTVTAADLKIVKGIHNAAEDAEVSAFNPAIAAASGAAATALKNGKIANKVLKLTAEVLGIQIEIAQGGSGSDLAAEQAKLANNIKLDTAAAGQPQTAVSFNESS